MISAIPSKKLIAVNVDKRHSIPSHLTENGERAILESSCAVVVQIEEVLVRAAIWIRRRPVLVRAIAIVPFTLESRRRHY